MKTILRVVGWFLGLVLVVAGAGFAWAYMASQKRLEEVHAFETRAIAVPTDAPAVEEGKRLVAIRCAGCHGEQGEGRVMFDDAKIARLVAPSLGEAARKYDDAKLAALIRTGVRPDGRSMIVMPSQVYRHLTDEDLGRIIAYVKSLPASTAALPVNAIGPLGRVGLATGKFKLAVREIADAAEPPQAADAAGQKGRYLAQTICAECHATDLRGKTTPVFVSTDLRSVGAYDEAAFRKLIREGVAVGNRELPFMGPVSRNHLSKLDDDEIGALYGYLRALK